MASAFDLQQTSLFFLMAFFAITFVQSAADKVVDRKGNLEFFGAHFKNSPLKNFASPMLTGLTLVEVLTAFATSYAAIRLIIMPVTTPVFWALCLCAINFLMLLTGQRLAKDYAGAASLANYFVLVMAGFLLLRL